MKNKFLLLLVILISISSCSTDNEDLPELELSEYEIDVINYFKDVALGFEFGNASSITRKWNSELKIFVDGEPSTELIDELEEIILEINGLTTDGFQINVVDQFSQSNYYIFLVQVLNMLNYIQVKLI